MEERDYNRLEALIQLFNEHGLEELAVEDGSFKLHLSRRPVEAEASAPRPAAPASAGRAAAGREQPRTGKGRTVAVRSPLIGVFYRAAAPDAPNFVDVGDMVEEGQTVCIVEAMKVFNEIKAEWSGRVVAIPAESGSLVQAGDPLVVLEFASGEGQEG